MKKWVIGLLLSLGAFLISSPTIQASQGQVLGIHILNPTELPKVEQLLSAAPTDDWHYVTVPISLADTQQLGQWQDFFNQAREHHLIPIVRLVTRFENGSWQVPSKKEITEYFVFLNQLPWPTQDRFIIVFNEPNHAAEWGGRVDPTSYGQTLAFATNWAHSEGLNYRVLPAGLDLAAPNGSQTMTAFAFLDQLLATQPETIAQLDYWNSHSYPNPGFSSSPERTSLNSLRGFIHELDYLKQRTGRNYEVFITETGWVETTNTRRWLTQYYQYAIDHVWSHPQVKGVTPFLLNGAPGPFAAFSFFDQQGQPTSQFFAYQQALKKSS